MNSLFDPPPRMTDTSMSAYHLRDRSTDLMQVMRLIVANDWVHSHPVEAVAAGLLIMRKGGAE